MDVKCERCSTEYEFDDALVSGRGTTVKCTNCGHKFKIRRGDGDFSEDFWNVTTGDGRTLVFTSLRELQRAIQSYLVERNDRLSRGGLPPKAIGQIPELAPFFDQRERREHKTQNGLGPSSEAPSPPDDFAPDLTPPLPAKTTLIGTGPLTSEPALPPMRARAPSIPPALQRPPSVPPPLERGRRSFSSLPPPVPPPRREGIDTAPLKLPSGPPAMPARKSIPPPLPDIPPPAAVPFDVAHAVESRIDRTTPLPQVRRSLIADLEEPSSLPDGVPSRRRRGVGGAVVAVIVVGCVVVLGAVWAQKNLGATLAAKPAPSAATVDPRVADFLVNGDKALANGNLDLAKESFDKASALAEKDAHVLVAQAHLAAVRADVLWLKTRLLPAEATDERRITHDGLDDAAATARKAADDALAVAADDPAALRAKIDAARISGDRDGARALVGKITSSQRAVDPETAYVLAALDLAEAEPLWTTVIERLKVAASAETGPGRARAALVYALARSGDASGAMAEVERLGAMSRAHPLLPLLRALAERTKDADAGTAAPPEVRPGKGRVRGVGGGGGGLDARDLIIQGERARGRGEYEKARGFFNTAVERNPNDSEALAGLAAIAHAQHDVAGARAAYNRVLAINPNYLPAVIGLADLEWESGNKIGASRMYKEIVERYPDGTYPARAKQRAEGGG